MFTNSASFNTNLRVCKISLSYIFCTTRNPLKLFFVITQTFERTIRRTKVWAEWKFSRIYGQAFFKKGVNNDRNIFRSSKRALRFSRFAVQPTNSSWHALPIFFFVPPNESILKDLSIKFIHLPLQLSNHAHLFLL